MSLYSHLTSEELVRAVDNLRNATDMEALLAGRLGAALEKIELMETAMELDAAVTARYASLKAQHGVS